MTQYNSQNLNLSNSQLNKLKSTIKNKTKVALTLSLSMVGDEENNFSHKLLLTNRQVANLRKAFANKSSTDIKLSKSKISRMIQSGGFFGSFLGPLLKTGRPLITVINQLAKSVLVQSGLTAAVSAADAGKPTTLIISNDEIKDNIEIVESLEDSSLLPEEVSKTIQNGSKKRGFFSMLLGTLGAILLGNILTG